MKRLISGSALIGLSLFMLLGFTKAKLPTSRVVKVFAFGIAVVLVAELGIDLASATQHLTILTHQDLAELEITASGTLVYAFHDIQALSEKTTPRRIRGNRSRRDDRLILQIV